MDDSKTRGSQSALTFCRLAKRKITVERQAILLVDIMFINRFPIIDYYIKERRIYGVLETYSIIK